MPSKKYSLSPETQIEYVVLNPCYFLILKRKTITVSKYTQSSHRPQRILWPLPGHIAPPDTLAPSRPPAVLQTRPCLRVCASEEHRRLSHWTRKVTSKSERNLKTTEQNSAAPKQIVLQTGTNEGQ